MLNPTSSAHSAPISCALITGATGFIGSWLTKLFLHHNIRVVALGRKPWEQVDPQRLAAHELLTYIPLAQEQLSSVPKYLEAAGISAAQLGHNAVFYNLAWGSSGGLSDLDVAGQMGNVLASQQAFLLAEALGCKRFVQIGTMEEAFTEAYLPLDFHHAPYYNRHIIYAEAKRCARMTLKAMCSSLHCELIIVNQSHIMGPLDHRDSFITATMKRILKGEPLRFTPCEQYFDVVSVFDCVRALKVIGERGQPQAEYWIGSGHARPLKEYVNILLQLHTTAAPVEFGALSYQDVRLNKSVFSPELLQRDTGFTCELDFPQITAELYTWLQTGQVITHLD